VAVRKKGSRRIMVNGIEFRWSATGNDGWITIVIWPVKRDRVRIVGKFDYHSEVDEKPGDRGRYHLIKGQTIITNRVIREIIVQIGLEKIEQANREINLGQLEEIYDIDNALRKQLSID